MNNIGCGGCGGQVPSFITYPFKRGAMYQCDCCTSMHQPSTAQYPVSGYMQENAYMVINSTPYLLDNTTTNYGTKLSVSENVYTRLSKSPDPACINLTGSIDMTGDIITNTVWKSFIENVIASQYETLDRVLPIQKSSVVFRFYFTLRDRNGGVAYSSHVDSTCPNHLFHYTDINDFFVTSFKNVAVTNIPQLDYAGLYNLSIDRVEAFVNVINTKDHVTDNLNPYYQWINNNTHIAVQHDTIDSTQPDVQLMIGAVNMNYSVAVQLNVTTRLRINFTVYMSNTIMAGDSYGIYKALFNPTEEIVAQLMQEIEAMKIQMAEMQYRLNNLYLTCDEYRKGKTYKKGTLVWIIPGTLYQTTLTYTTTNDESVTVEEALETDVLDGKLVPVPSEE